MPRVFTKNPLASNWKPLSPRQWAIFLLILTLGVSVRSHDLGSYPRKYETYDEFHYLWVGLSLLQDGHATAWSLLGAYRSVGVAMQEVCLPDGGHMTVVTPALDHPPLFSLLAGAFAKLTSHPRLVPAPQPQGPPSPVWEIDLASARVLAVILSALTLFLLFQITRRAFSFPVACLAALFYAVTDHVVFNGRLLVTENLSTPLFLLNLVFLQAYASEKCSRSAFGAITIATCAAVLLCKVIAVSQAAAVIVLLLLCRKWRDIMFPMIGVLAGVALYAAYGYWQGWEVFRAVLGGQADRFSGFQAIIPIITTPAIVHLTNINTVLLSGWIALCSLPLLHRRARLLLAPLIYLLAFAFFASTPAIYGWHIIPFYPFLCMALAALIARVYRRHRPTEVTILMVLLLPGAFGGIWLGIGPAWAAWATRIAYMLVMVLVILMPAFGPQYHRLVTRVATIAVTTLILATQAYSSWNHEPHRSHHILREIPARK